MWFAIIWWDPTRRFPLYTIIVILNIKMNTIPLLASIVKGPLLVPVSILYFMWCDCVLG